MQNLTTFVDAPGMQGRASRRASVHVAFARPGKAPDPLLAPSALRLDAVEAGTIQARLAREVASWAARDPRWFGRAVRARIAARAAERASRSWTGARRPSVAECTRRAVRATAIAGGLSAATTQLAELLGVASGGLAAPFGFSTALTCAIGEAAYAATTHIDLVCDIAEGMGVPFDAEDALEVAYVIDLALHGRTQSTGSPTSSDEVVLVTRVGKSLVADALFGAIPVIGVALGIHQGVRSTHRVAKLAGAVVARRKALRDRLGRYAELRNTPVAALLLDATWLLATADGVATHDELQLLSALGRALGLGGSAWLHTLATVREDTWLDRVSALDATERLRLRRHLDLVSVVRGTSGAPERLFLDRARLALANTEAV